MADKIPFQDWEKLDIRTAKIVKAEDIEGADKLYKLTLDLGKMGKRTVCAGIKQHYEKDELKGKNIIFLENLEPRKMKGVVSDGMVLASEDENGRIVLLTAGQNAEPGSKVR